MGAAWAQLSQNRFRDVRSFQLVGWKCPKHLFRVDMQNEKRGIFRHGSLGTEIDRNGEDSKMSVTWIGLGGED